MMGVIKSAAIVKTNLSTMSSKNGQQFIRSLSQQALKTQFKTPENQSIFRNKENSVKSVHSSLSDSIA